MPDSDEEKNSLAWQKLRQRSARAMVLVTLVYCIVVGGIMAGNRFSLKQSGQSMLVELHSIKLQYSRQQDEQLSKQIRQLDQRYRQACVDGAVLQRQGRYFLGGGIVVLLIVMHLWMRSSRKMLTLREHNGVETTYRNQMRMVLFVVVFAAVLCGILLLPDEPEYIIPKKIVSEQVPEPKTQVIVQKPKFDPPAMKEWLQNWPCFRGGLGNGIAPFEVELDPAKLKIRNEIKLPHKGFGSPVIWNGKVFLSAADSLETQTVLCIDAVRMKILWQTNVPLPALPANRKEIKGEAGLAAATVVTDGNVVASIFGSGILSGVDFDGNLLWSVALGAEENHYGYASSLAYANGTVIIQYDNAENRRLIGVDISTGKIKWTTPRTGSMSWASPVISVLNCKNAEQAVFCEILTVGEPDVIAYDPGSGKELWRVKGLFGEVAPSAVFHDGKVYAAMDGAGLFCIGTKETAENTSQFATSKQTNKPEIIWNEMPPLPDTSSPLVAEGKVILCASYGTVSCVDATSGKTLWMHDTDEGYYASPTWAAGVVWLLDRAGNLTAIKIDQNKEWDVAGTLQLSEPTAATPAFTKNSIWVRTETRLLRIGNADE